LKLTMAPWIRKAYKDLIKVADNAFKSFAERYNGIKCAPRCTDCCHAVFGLFHVEGILIHEAYQRLNNEIKAEVAHRAFEALNSLKFLSNLNGLLGGKAISQKISRIKIRCPFLGDDQLCVIYQKRPITCRVYGIPILLRGTIRRCPLSALEEEHLTTFDMDSIHKKLYELSSFFLKDNRIFDQEKSRLMISVPYAILKPYDVLIDQSVFGGLL